MVGVADSRSSQPAVAASTPSIVTNKRPWIQFVFIIPAFVYEVGWLAMASPSGHSGWASCGDRLAVRSPLAIT